MSAPGWISDFLTHRITVADASGRNAYGDPAFGAQRIMAARVVGKVNRVIGRDSEEITTDTVLYLAEPVSLEARIWLPGADVADAGAARRPVSITSSPDIDGGDGLITVYL